MADNDGKGGKGGWSDRDLLSTLLSIIEKSNTTLNWKDGVYPAGRNANGFRQKINQLKIAFKPEWEALETGQPGDSSKGAAKKATNPRKRKAKDDEITDGVAEGNTKKRGRPKKNVTPEEREETPVKEEVKDEEDESEENI